jgi:hypothetical protein
MRDREFVKRIEKEIISGEYKLPFSGKELQLENGICFVPEKPDRADVINVREKGVGYRSVLQRDYDEGQARRQVNDFVRDIGALDLREYYLEFDFVDNINGPLPKDGRLDSMIYDQGIKIRPVDLRKMYGFDLRVGYNSLTQKISEGLEKTRKDTRLSLENLRYFSEKLKGDTSSSTRGYVWNYNAPMRIDRWPIWINVNAEGIENEARLPLEVMSNLLEPHTSAWIVRRNISSLNRNQEEFEGKKASLKPIEQNELRKELTLSSSRDIEANINRSLSEERALATTIVRRWLMDKRSKNNLSADEILGWNPYPQNPSYNHDLSLKYFRDFRRVKTRDIARFYCSELWEEWAKGIIGIEDIDF